MRPRRCRCWGRSSPPRPTASPTGCCSPAPRSPRRRPKGDNADALKDQALAAAFAAYRHAQGKNRRGRVAGADRRDFRRPRSLARRAQRLSRQPRRLRTAAGRRKPMTICARNTVSACWTTRSTMNREPARLFPVFRGSFATAQADFSPFVTLDGRSDAAVSSEERQICVEGLKHGEHYAIALRQGLPSAVGENLLRNQDYADLRPRPFAAGAFYRAQLRAAARRAGGRPGRLGQYARK